MIRDSISCDLLLLRTLGIREVRLYLTPHFMHSFPDLIISPPTASPFPEIVVSIGSYR